MSLSNDLTLKSQVLALRYSEKEGSLRLCNPTGVLTNGDLRLKIQHVPYTDNATQVESMRSNVRFEFDRFNATNEKFSCYVQATVGRPVNVTTISDVTIQEIIDMLIQLLSTTAADASALDKADDIFVTLLQ